MRARVWFSVVTTLVIAGCSGRGGESTRFEAKLVPCELPDEHDLDHTCLHAAAGPFRDVTAAPVGTEALADVSRPHTIFRVTLPRASSDGGAIAYEGVTTFVPRETGDYAVYTSSEVPDVAVRSASGHEPTPLACSLRLPKNTCDGRLQFLRALELEADQAYQLVWGPSAGEKITVLIERQEVSHGRTGGEGEHEHEAGLEDEEDEAHAR